MIFELFAAILVFLSIFVPGFLLALPLLRRLNMSLLELSLFGFTLGLVAVPGLLFLEALAGVKFSFLLVVANAVFASAAGLVLSLRSGGMPKKIDFNARRDYPWLLLLGIVLFAFWLRAQTIGPAYYEFDPYYYDVMTQQIVTQGHVPRWDGMAWYPYVTSHINPALMQYVEATWYSIYSTVMGMGFDVNTLATVAGVTTPVIGALMAFFAFFFVSAEYGRKFGFVAAALIATMPQLIQKFTAGGNEQQPWGIFAAFFFYAAYAAAVKRDSLRLALLAGIALATATLGSKQDILVYLVLAGYIGLQSLASFIRNNDLRRFAEINAIVALFGVASHTVLSVFSGEPIFDVGPELLGLLSAVFFALALLAVSKTAKEWNRRMLLLGVLLAVFLVLVAVTPIGSRMMGYVSTAIGYAKAPTPLGTTVAEETPTDPGIFAGSFGKYLANPQLFFAAAALAMLYAAFRGSRLALFYALAIFPVSYIGLNKVKYTLHLGYALAVAVSILFGEIAVVLAGFLKEPRDRLYAGYAVFAVAGVIVLLQATVPFESHLLDGLRMTTLTGAYGGNAGWVDALEWMKNNVGEQERVLFWWDYGHWTNFFAQKKAVTRNDNGVPEMDLEVADAFVGNDSAKLIAYMRNHKARYVLFDFELIRKWGALVFLSCVQNMEILDWQKGPGSSKDCEISHYFEFISLQGPDANCPSDAQQRAGSSFGGAYCIGQDRAYAYEVAQTPRGLAATGKLLPLSLESRYLVRQSDTNFINLNPDLSWLKDASGKAYLQSKLAGAMFVQGFFARSIPGLELAYENDLVRVYKLAS